MEEQLYDCLLEANSLYKNFQKFKPTSFYEGCLHSLIQRIKEEARKGASSIRQEYDHGEALKIMAALKRAHFKVIFEGGLCFQDDPPHARLTISWRELPPKKPVPHWTDSKDITEAFSG